MKIFRIFGRSIKNAGKSIFRNLSLSIASVTCAVITLVLVSIGMLLSYNINKVTKNIENELTIVIFMDKDINESELNKTKEDLMKIDNVKSVKFNSKEDVDKYLEICEKWSGRTKMNLEHDFIKKIIQK